MSEKTTQAVNVATEIAREAANSPKVAAALSAWILGVNWLDVVPDIFKIISSVLAFVILCLVVGNHLLTRKKLKLEIKALTKSKVDK